MIRLIKKQFWHLLPGKCGASPAFHSYTFIAVSGSPNGRVDGEFCIYRFCRHSPMLAYNWVVSNIIVGKAILFALWLPIYLLIVIDLGFLLYSLWRHMFCSYLKAHFYSPLAACKKILRRNHFPHRCFCSWDICITCTLFLSGKHKNRWRDSSAENRVIGDYEVEEWKDVGKCNTYII